MTTKKIADKEKFLETSTRFLKDFFSHTLQNNLGEIELRTFTPDFANLKMTPLGVF